VWLSRAELLTLAAKIAAQADELRRLGDARGAARYDWRAAELRGLASQTTTPSAQNESLKGTPRWRPMILAADSSAGR
jgi:hypothetical protein